MASSRLHLILQSGAARRNQTDVRSIQASVDLQVGAAELIAGVEPAASDLPSRRSILTNSTSELEDPAGLKPAPSPLRVERTVSRAPSPESNRDDRVAYGALRAFRNPVRQARSSRTGGADGIWTHDLNLDGVAGTARLPYSASKLVGPAGTDPASSSL